MEEHSDRFRQRHISSITFVALIAVSLLSHSNLFNLPEVAASGYQCNLVLDLKEYVFEQSESIPIKINDTCEIYADKVVTVSISNPDTGIDENGAAMVDSASTFSTKSIQISGKTTEATLDLPRTSSMYRFLISVTDDKNEIKDQAFIFSKRGADIVQISDISLTENVSAGSQFEVTATIKDGLGNPMPSTIVPIVTLQRPECSSGTFLGIPLDLRLTRGDNPSRYGAQVLVPANFSSGVYKASLSVYVAPSKGYQTIPTITSDVNVSGGDIPVTMLFYNVEELNATLFSPVQVGRQYVPGDDIVLRGQVMTDDCQKLSGVRITGDFFDLPTPLIRASSVSDSLGNFAMHFQTYPSLSTEMQYGIRLKAEYSNKTFTWTDSNVSLEDVRRYPFDADGKTSRAEVKASAGGDVQSLTLDKDLKKLTVVLESQRNNQVQYRIAIPSELLSGDVMIQKDDGEPIVLIDQYFGDQNGPEMDPGVDIRHSYYLAASKTGPYLMVDYVDLIGGQTKLEIKGTSVIPEFVDFIPTAAVAISIMYLYTILRPRIP